MEQLLRMQQNVLEQLERAVPLQKNVLEQLERAVPVRGGRVRAPGGVGEWVGG